MAGRNSDPSGNDLPTPPYSDDLLADLHAGVLPESVSERLWPLVHRDPRAMDTIAALDKVTDQLRALGRDHSVETPIPPDVAARINSALAESAAPEYAAAPLGRRKRWAAVAAGTCAAAAALVVALAVVTPNDQEPLETDTPATALDLGGELERGQVLTLIGSTELGPLTDPGILAECLQANGIEESRTLLGSGEVRLDGVPGVLLLFAGPRPPQITALVVGTDCRAGNPATLTVDEIG
ncbi:MAG: hypothetical protein WAW17_27035 [Rhodococcus sp. (in: high G+C Gram-positive bacteria)]|uniref:hypothetical protein n=1 Tax=Rhodococcus sp. TaxID=1831 RepID=UPI003BB1B795